MCSQLLRLPITIKLGLELISQQEIFKSSVKKKGQPWELAKGFDHSAVIGKFYDKSELNLEDLNFTLQKNGVEVQKGHVQDMLFSIDEIICYLSRFFKLQKGDYIFTGTPEGVGPVSMDDCLEGFLSVGNQAESSFLF